jgi:hypothetical protein
MIKRIRAYLARRVPRIFRRRHYSGVRVVERISEIPNDTKDFVYLVRRSGVHQWAVLDCPCRTGHQITVNLRKQDHPHWIATNVGHSVSLHPSLWFHDGCKSHFWIENNRVTWV